MIRFESLCFSTFVSCPFSFIFFINIRKRSLVNFRSIHINIGRFYRRKGKITNFVAHIRFILSIVYLYDFVLCNNFFAGFDLQHKIKQMKTSKKLLTDNVAALLTQEQSSKLKDVELMILLDFAHCCDSHSLHYSLAYGTLLGAVRHHGFIPWDDDIDVFLPEEEFFVFIDSLKKDYGAKYTLTGLGVDSYLDPFLALKMSLTGTILLEVEAANFPFKRGISIDIFPVFHSSNNRFLRLVQGNRYRFLCHGSALRYEHKYPSSPLLHNPNKTIRHYFRMKYLMSIFTCFRSIKGWEKKRDRIVFKGFKTSPNRAMGIDKPFFGKTPFKTDFSNRTQLTFEGHLFWCFENFKEFLAFRYGSDYMAIPPIEKREKHAVYEIDFGPY
jgi:lipopolysaccharide cholinephosphotransferase